MSQSASRAKPLLAMVALDTPSLPSPQALQETFPAMPGLFIDWASLQTKENAIVFSINNGQFSLGKAAVALVTAPIPWSNLEGPCATAWWWPAATERMKAHTSHILIALNGGSGPLALRYLMLTHLTATVAARVDAAAHGGTAGIYWPAGSLVHDSQMFINQAHNITPNQLPLHLWIDFRIEPMDDGCQPGSDLHRQAKSLHRLFTTGMRAFHQEEIEIPPTHQTPADMLDFATTVAEYIIRTNPEIGEENTIGRSENEKIPAAYRPSMIDPTMTVLRLEY